MTRSPAPSAIPKLKSERAPIVTDGRGVALGQLDRLSYVTMIRETVLESVLTISSRDLTRETGGFLLGRTYDRPRPTVVVERFIPAHAGRGTAASLTFTAETWSDLRAERAELCPDLDVVGWHHTHPGLGLFFSGYDRFIHAHFFGKPFQVATVVDPIAEELILFQWRDNQIVDAGVCPARGSEAVTAIVECR